MLALAGCGSPSTDLKVSVTKVTKGDPKPGDDVNFLAEVTNNGPAQATGVAVRIDLPTAFRFKATRSIDSTGPTARTQPSDPGVDSVSPQWGSWSLGAPGINADGTPAHAYLDIAFSVRVDGRPADYNLVPHVFSDAGDEIDGKPLSVHLLPSSDLSLAITTFEPTARRGDDVQYHLTLLNQGSGVASGIGILITLPDGLIFDKSQPPTGTFSRKDAIDPVSGALIVYYGGWVLPPASQARPGTLNLVFSAKVLATAIPGRYTVSAQLTDDTGNVEDVNNTAPVTILAPTPTPSPSVSPGSSPQPTVRPGATPTPTPPPPPTPTPTPRKP